MILGSKWTIACVQLENRLAAAQANSLLSQSHLANCRRRWPLNAEAVCFRLAIHSNDVPRGYVVLAIHREPYLKVRSFQVAPGHNCSRCLSQNRNWLRHTSGRRHARKSDNRPCAPAAIRCCVPTNVAPLGIDRRGTERRDTALAKRQFPEAPRATWLESIRVYPTRVADLPFAAATKRIGLGGEGPADKKTSGAAARCPALTVNGPTMCS